jgi:hypothetical protein
VTPPNTLSAPARSWQHALDSALSIDGRTGILASLDDPPDPPRGRQALSAVLSVDGRPRISASVEAPPRGQQARADVLSIDGRTDDCCRSQAAP